MYLPNDLEAVKLFVSVLQIYGTLNKDVPVMRNIQANPVELGEGQRIVGGRPAERHSYPYQVSLQYYLPILGNWYHYCGGSILNANTIITAAHCIRGFERLKLRVAAGDHDLAVIEGPEQKIVFPIENVHVHDNYNGSTIDYDFAVIKLPLLLKITPGVVEPIDPVDKDEPADQDCVSTGWGNTDGSGTYAKYPSVLQQVKTPLVDQEICAQNYSTIEFDITPRMVCAGGPPEDGKEYQGICQGDSGGPLMCKTKDGKRRLVGLSSFSTNPCGGEFPAGYASVLDQVEWIKSFIV